MPEGFLRFFSVSSMSLSFEVNYKNNNLVALLHLIKVFLSFFPTHYNVSFLLESM